MLGMGQAGAGGCCQIMPGCVWASLWRGVCPSSMAEGSLAAVPAFLTPQQSKHGVNSALQGLVAVSRCASGVIFHPRLRSSCTAGRGSVVSRVQSVQITAVPIERVGNSKMGETPTKQALNIQEPSHAEVGGSTESSSGFSLCTARSSHWRR